MFARFYFLTLGFVKPQLYTWRDCSSSCGHDFTRSLWSEKLDDRLQRPVYAVYCRTWMITIVFITLLSAVWRVQISPLVRTNIQFMCKRWKTNRAGILFDEKLRRINVSMDGSLRDHRTQSIKSPTPPPATVEKNRLFRVFVLFFNGRRLHIYK